MNKKKLFYIGFAVALIALIASQLFPVLIASFTDDPLLFWWAIITLPASFLLAGLISGNHLKNSNSFISKFMKEYLHILLMLFSFIGLLIYTEIIKT